jgi:hypothetical protein
MDYKSTKNEHLGSKVKRFIGWVQTWALSLITLLQSLQILYQMCIVMEKTLGYALLLNYKNS